MPLDKSGFVGGSFAISLSRTNDFNRTIKYHGTNEQTSIIDSFIDDANGGTTDQFIEGGAFYDIADGSRLSQLSHRASKHCLIQAFRMIEYFSDVKTIPDQRETD